MKVNVLLSLITMIIVILSIILGVESLTGNWMSGYWFGLAGGWFAYQVVLALLNISDSVKKNS